MPRSETVWAVKNPSGELWSVEIYASEKEAAKDLCDWNPRETWEQLEVRGYRCEEMILVPKADYDALRQDAAEGGGR